MFSGIVESTSRIEKVDTKVGLLTVWLKKPSFFNDIEIGDSIAVNGVCLTVESISSELLSFSLAAETLHITGWTQEKLLGSSVNLERSMKLDQRVHGHFVLGHVDGVAQVVQRRLFGESLFLTLSLPQEFSPYVWKKGSITLNGVSLTINEATGGKVEVCLIPETLRRTNLMALEEGESVTFEVDSMARAFVNLWKMERPDAKI